MSRLYLFTGFLGAGKTTCLKKFVKKFGDCRIHIIVNEFGKEGIDGTLMGELGIALEEINNGSIFCACRLDKFEEVLQRTLADSPDVIIVEASGLGDPTNVKKILGQTEKFSRIEYMGCICLVDALSFRKVYETATVVKKQINVSDMILVNKTDLASEEQVEQAKYILKKHRPDLPIHGTSRGEIKDEWLKELKKPEMDENTEIFQTAEITLRKYLLHIREEATLEEVCNFLKMILDDTFRIKGFLFLENQWYLVNCAGNLLSAEVYQGKNPGRKNVIVVLSGYGLSAKKAIRHARNWYPQVVEKVE